MKKEEKVAEYFRNGYNCAQSVLTAFGQDFNMSENTCLKVACAFGAGMGRQQHTCGAVTGALMVLGLKYGKALNEDNSKKIETYKKTNEFISEFTRINGSINCKSLMHGLDMNIEADMKKINELKLFETNCVDYVKSASNILEKMLA